jgi:hypothetical protein
MTKWERRLDRGLGYLGLFLIGSISWLADHLRGGRAPEATGGSRPERRVLARRMAGSVTTDARAGQRAA